MGAQRCSAVSKMIWGSARRAAFSQGSRTNPKTTELGAAAGGHGLSESIQELRVPEEIRQQTTVSGSARGPGSAVPPIPENAWKRMALTFVGTAKERMSDGEARKAA